MTKRVNSFIGLIGGLMTIAIAPGLAVGGMLILSAITFVAGIVIVDWNRNGN